MVRQKLVPVLFAFLTTCSSGSFCTIAKPHRFSDATVNIMSDVEVKQELSYDKTGQELCGWKQ
jgi:hypothetical protein